VHTDKNVRKVLKEARLAGWQLVEYPKGYTFGHLACGLGCKVTLLRTPKGDGQARILRERLAKCPHGKPLPRRR